MMTDWKNIKLNEVASIRATRKLIEQDKIAFIPMELISGTELYTKFEIRGKQNVKSFTYCESGDLLLAKITPSLENGKQGIVPYDIPNGQALATTEVFPIICDDIETLCLFYVLKLPHYRNQIIASMIGTTGRQRASKKSIENLKVFVPQNRIEQKAIAQILSTVDEAIQKADEAIKHTERLKQGLMQKLLTEGIGHTEFKETKIGRIPKEWEVQPIGNLGKVITGKTPSTLRKEYWNGDIPFITPGDIVNSKYVYTTERRVTKEGVSTITQNLPPNSLLVVCIGSTIGKVGLTFTECITNQQINSIVLDRRHYDASYIYYAFLKISKKFKSYSGTAAVPIIKKSLFEKYLLPVPSFHEQKRIGEILSIVDKKAEIERKRKVRFENIKKGLMNDLLTGKKRVKV